MGAKEARSSVYTQYAALIIPCYYGALRQIGALMIQKSNSWNRKRSGAPARITDSADADDYRGASLWERYLREPVWTSWSVF